MTDEGGQPATEELASSEPEGQPEASPEAAAAPEASPDEQPAEDMVSAEEAQKRLSGLQSAFQRKFDKQERRLVDLEGLRTEYDDLKKKDMTEAQRSEYDSGKRTAAQDRRDQELQEREDALREYDTFVSWRGFYVDAGVPAEVFKDAETYEDIQSAAHPYIQGRLKQPAPSAPPSGPQKGDQVQAGTGSSVPASEFAELIAEGIPPWSDRYKELRKKILRERKIV